ncbi:MAG: hypothetical protein DMG17_33735 [Acidobacteria bacterium]|nr:MAG: hypothetical protein DMG17_33735 [Acidobacteriota bacterium]
MKAFRIAIAIIAVAMFITLSASNAKADEWDKKTLVTFDQPVEIPGMVLPAGTYVFRRASSTDPNVNGSPRAIKSWFYPGDTSGEEFVYRSSGKTINEIGALQTQIAELRDAQMQQAQRLDAVNQRAQAGLAEANQAAMAAKAANQIATAADRMAANADRRAEAAQFNAKAALNQIGTVAGQIETRITNMDKYRVADQSTVTFAFNSDVLSEQDMSTLDAVAASVATPQGGDLIELEGFTDNIGTEKYNLGLSDRRVESVLRYLVSKRVPLYRISLVGLGKADPVSDNQTAAGREQNRRVEIRVLRSSDSVSTAAR